MKSTDLPALVGTPFAENGIKTPISQNTSPGTNAASYNDGFPAITMTELNNGGLPPRGSDFNQILYELAKSVQWAGTGALYKFSAEFATKIGGYPKGSKVIGSDGDVYECLADDNMNDPVGGAGWVNKGEDKNTRELWRRSLAEIGLTLVPGSFKEGATVTSATDAVWDIDGAQCYTWTGDFPHDAEGEPGVGWVEVKSGGVITIPENTPSDVLVSIIEGNPHSILLIIGESSLSDAAYCVGATFTGGRITGTGTLSGTVTSMDGIYNHVNVKNNLVVHSHRNNEFVPGAYDVVVDPISKAGIKTVQEGINHFSSLVEGGAKGVTLLLRAGRHEVMENLDIPDSIKLGYSVDNTLWGDSTIIDDVETFCVPDPKLGLRIRSYPKESATVSGNTKWFFVNDSTGTYEGHPVVPNSIKFYKLYSPTGTVLSCASSADPITGSTQRNLDRDVKLYSENGKTYSSIRVPNDTMQGLINLTDDELQSLRVRLTHWYTSSSHSTEFTLNGDILKFRSHIADTEANKPLTNGWAYLDTNLYGCPFYVENSKYFIKQNTDFVGTSTYAILPVGEKAYFTVDYSNRLDVLLDFADSRFISIAGDISIKYQQGYPVTVDSTTNRAFPLGVAGVRLGELSSIKNAKVADVEGTGVILGRLGNFVTDCDISRVTSNGVANSTPGSHHGKVSRCKINDYALDQLSSFGVVMSGVDIEVSDSVVINGGFSAIRCDSSYFVSDKSEGDTHYGIITRNLCNNIGMRNGITSDRYATGDTGVATTNGRGPETAYWYVGNVFANSAERSGLGTRGIFLDDGVNGVRMINNLIWGVQRYSIDARQVSGDTYNNRAYGNVLVGDVRFQSATLDSSLLAFNIIYGTAPTDILSQDNRLASENNFKCVQGNDNLTIQNLDVIFSKLTKFTMNYVRRLSFI